MAVTAGSRRITTYVGARLRVLDVNFDVLSVSADAAVDSGIDINTHGGNGCICTGQGRLEESPLNVMHGGRRSVVSETLRMYGEHKPSHVSIIHDAGKFTPSSRLPTVSPSRHFDAYDDGRRQATALPR